MKKLLLIFTFLTAFAVNGFAFSGSAYYELREVGYRTENVTMNCDTYVYFTMGTGFPGFVEVYGYRSDGGSTLHAKVDYPQYGDFFWPYPMYGCQINIAVFSLSGDYHTPCNGIYINWN